MERAMSININRGRLTGVLLIRLVNLDAKVSIRADASKLQALAQNTKLNWGSVSFEIHLYRLREKAFWQGLLIVECNIDCGLRRNSIVHGDFKNTAVIFDAIQFQNLIAFVGEKDCFLEGTRSEQ